jgi:hypothetical protein
MSAQIAHINAGHIVLACYVLELRDRSREKFVKEDLTLHVLHLEEMLKDVLETAKNRKVALHQSRATLDEVRAFCEASDIMDPTDFERGRMNVRDAILEILDRANPEPN